MTGRLAAVPNGTTDGATAATCPPRCMYRDWIRTVAVSGAQIRSTLFSNSHPGQSGSSIDSGASDSYPSKSSGRSSGLAAPDLGAHELTTIARQMVSDGYTKRVVEAFSATSPAPALENWFSELDVDWILQIGNEHGSWWQLQLGDNSALSLRDMVERWIRALTVIAGSIAELVFARHETSKVARFGTLSIAKMLEFVDAIVPAPKAENLRAVLDMYICASNVSYMFTPLDMSPEAQIIFTETASSLGTTRNKLNNAILSTMMEVRTLMEDDDSWAIEIPRGGGDVHRNTRFMVDYIVSMRKARASTENCAPSDNTVNLGDLIDATFDYI
ncbi:hypothetical protein CFC21_019887 [Triticum aestivum]|uniref:Exocyst subunit Exo70 family protein n=2 Tax=Triticum aestivum TaxID=4565 RepID=A0A3B6B7M7_WHEAT|nr:hypothetical protein CFC21_019887 [Triticum aestivum]